MALVLLKCSICPRQPDFSDISHLLTHISSKGHLAHLHKLQVRSHQEVAAGQQLAAYNLWYQQHGLGQLLSERLQQKDAKKASSSKNKRTKPASKKTRGAASAADTRTAPIVPAPPSRPGLRSRTNASFESQHQSFAYAAWNERSITHPYPSEDEDIFDSSPTPKIRSLRNSAYIPPALKRSSSDITGSADPDEDEEESEASRLKGLIWPGMDIFDAATEEMRRKRNQKKDGSLLKQMKKCSERIEATETIYSPSGIMRKQRPITGNVEDASPLKGETPIPKKRVGRSKRAALTETTDNVPVTRRRATRATAGQRGRGKSIDTSYSYVSNQHNFAPYDLADRYLPIEDDRTELGLTLGYGLSKPRKGGLSVLKDNRDSEPMSQHPSAAPASTYDYPGFGKAEPCFEYESSHRDDHTGNQIDSCSWRQTRSDLFQPPDSGKENNDPSLHIPGMHNPLGLTDYSIETKPPRLGTNKDQGHFAHGIPTHGLPTDSFGYSANPLSYAFQQLQCQSEDPFTDLRYGFEEMSGKDCLGGLGGALSETEGTDLPNGFFGDERH